MNSRISMNTNATNAICEVNRMMHKMRTLKDFMKGKTRLMVANSFMKSKLANGLMLYIRSNQMTKNKKGTCMMRVGR